MGFYHLLPMNNWMYVWLKSDTFFVVKKDLNNPNLFIKTNRIHSYLISQQLTPLPPEAPNNTWCSWVLWVKDLCPHAACLISTIVLYLRKIPCYFVNSVYFFNFFWKTSDPDSTPAFPPPPQHCFLDYNVSLCLLSRKTRETAWYSMCWPI